MRRSLSTPKVPIVRISTWDEYRSLVESARFRSWGFRGHADARWPLFSALSRYLLYAKVHGDAWPAQEERILRIFRRKAHLFLDHIPPEDDSFQWLGLMQHHGAPTRLLDVTWSPYVALFFAIEHGSELAAVWAFNAGALNETDHHYLRDGRSIDLRDVGTWEPTSYEEHFLRGQVPFVIIGEPKIMNRRLVAQSGTFIIPAVLDQPIEDILAGYVDSDRFVTKIEIDVSRMRDDAMRQLYGMNITPATLFPDLDGLARSMAYELEYHWAFDTRTMIPYPGFPPPHQLAFWGLPTHVRRRMKAAKRPNARLHPTARRGKTRRRG
jgi:FRG domain-containing protein